MSYTAVDAPTITPAPGSHPAASPYDKGIGRQLGVHTFGLYQVELPAGAASVEHDHVDDGAEDVYGFILGTGTVVVDGEEVSVGPSSYVAVSPTPAAWSERAPTGSSTSLSARQLVCAEAASRPLPTTGRTGGSSSSTRQKRSVPARHLVGRG